MKSETSKHAELVVHTYVEERAHLLSPVFQVPLRYARRLNELIRGLSHSNEVDGAFRVTYLCRGFYDLVSPGRVVVGGARVIGNQIWANEPLKPFIEQAFKSRKIPYRMKRMGFSWTLDEPVELRKRNKIKYSPKIHS